MPTIPYEAKHFGRHWGPSLAGGGSMTIPWQDFVWAAITVGKPGISYLLAHRWHSISDIIVRAHTVYANLREKHLHVEKSTLYERLDPTEKGAISYFIGMMAAKIVGQRLLNTPWLFHLSTFSTIGGIITPHSKSQPDLIGLNNRGNWIIVEAKGRTNGYNDEAMMAAKNQTRKVRQINGQYPALRAAVQAYFKPTLNFAIHDPDEFDDDAVDLFVQTEQALHRYYQCANDTNGPNRYSRRIKGHEFLFQSIEDIGISIGIDRRVEAAIQGNRPQQEIMLALKDINSAMQGDEKTRLFPDGLAVSVDKRWFSENMSRNPLDRTTI